MFNVNLLIEIVGDIFPDPMARREILQLRVRCPTRKQRSANDASSSSSTTTTATEGCPALIRLADVEHHAAQCQHNRLNRDRFVSGMSLAILLINKLLFSFLGTRHLREGFRHQTVTRAASAFRWWRRRASPSQARG